MWLKVRSSKDICRVLDPASWGGPQVLLLLGAQHMDAYILSLEPQTLNWPANRMNPEGPYTLLLWN